MNFLYFYGLFFGLIYDGLGQRDNRCHYDLYSSNKGNTKTDKKSKLNHDTKGKKTHEGKGLKI